MRAVLRFFIQLAAIILVIWLLVKYTTLDDSVISFFRANSTVTQTGSMTNEDPNVCTTPWGVKIPDGSSVYAYWTSTPGGSDCKEEIRTCVKGALDGSYPYASCSNNSNSTPTHNEPIAQGAMCTTPWGESVNDGAYIIAYESINSCRFEKRYCENGRLNGSYGSNTCYSPTGVAQGGNNVTQNVTTISYGAVQGTTTQSDYQGPSRTSTNGKTTVIYSWNDNKTNPTSTNGNDSQYVDPVRYKNYDLTQHGCTTPWGKYMDSNTWVIAYRSSKPSGVAGSCEYERRTCFQGVLGGSYQYATCANSDSSKIYNNNGQDYFYPSTTNSANSCTTPWGETVRNGDYVLSYKTSYTSQGYACQGEYRYCVNGKLNGSYQNRSCTMSQDKYRCQLPWGGTIPHGSSVVAYANSSSPCASQIRTCSYGKLSGTYKNAKCQSTTTNKHSCYLPWGGSIPHGASTFAYSSPYGNCYSERRTCNDGYLGGSYQYSTCSTNNYNNTCNGYNCGNSWNNNINHSCQLPWGGSIAHGSSVIAYSNSSAPCSSQTRTCYNGYLNGSYSYSSCYNNNNNCNGGNCNNNNYGNRSCTTPWGQVIAHGEKVEAYQNTSAPCYKQTRTCRDGNLDGSYQYNSCDSTSSNGGTDTYGNWQDAGLFEGNIDGKDTCNSNATSAYTCGSEGTNSCTDYARVSCNSFSPLICTYQKRNISCVR